MGLARMLERQSSLCGRTRTEGEFPVLRRLLSVFFMFAALAPAKIRAADTPQIKVSASGKISVPATTAFAVIATDPVLQEILGQDLQVAGRLADGTTPSLTLTVTLTHRALEPGISLAELAPGNGEAVALLNRAGVKAPPLPDDSAQNQDEDSGAGGPNAAEGNSEAKNDVKSYAQQGQIIPESGPMLPALPIPMTQWPLPPAMAQDRSALPAYDQVFQPRNPLEEARHQREMSAIYDTVYIAHATAGTEGKGLTVVAVAHPGSDPHDLRKLIAEEIANAVLH
jgi:hypothetical protein